CRAPRPCMYPRQRTTRPAARCRRIREGWGSVGSTSLSRRDGRLLFPRRARTRPARRPALRGASKPDATSDRKLSVSNRVIEPTGRPPALMERHLQDWAMSWWSVPCRMGLAALTATARDALAQLHLPDLQRAPLPDPQ